MLVWQKPKRFSEIFIPFLQFRNFFSHFEKKDQLDSLNISEFIEPEICRYFNAQKVLF